MGTRRSNRYSRSSKVKEIEEDDPQNQLRSNELTPIPRPGGLSLFASKVMDVGLSAMTPEREECTDRSP